MCYHVNSRLKTGVSIMGTYMNWFIAMNLHAKLVQLRKKKGLTQQQMAEAAGIHLTQIKRYESGASQPSLEALKKIAVALSVTTDSLLFEETERGPDEDLRLQFETITRMPKKERQIIRELLEGMIIKYEAQRWQQQRTAS